MRMCSHSTYLVKYGLLFFLNKKKVAWVRPEFHKYPIFDQLFLNYAFRNKCQIYVNNPSSKWTFYGLNLVKFTKIMVFFCPGFVTNLPCCSTKKREFNVYLFKLIYCNPCDSVNVHDVDAQREFVTWHCKSCRNVTSLWLSSAAAQPFVFSERSRMPTIKVPNTLHFEVFLNPCMLVCFDHTTLVYKNTFSSSKLLPPSRPILGSLSHNPHQ